jgi:hypothetical protein
VTKGIFLFVRGAEEGWRQRKQKRREVVPAGTIRIVSSPVESIQNFGNRWE